MPMPPAIPGRRATSSRRHPAPPQALGFDPTSRSAQPRIASTRRARVATACSPRLFHKWGLSVRPGSDTSGMAKNFIAVDREQVFLMPPSLREWLPEGHLAWCVLDAVAEMDLSAFYERYREDGPGRPAYEPAMMVALVLYAYAKGQRSSRGIERECWEDVAYRVITANLAPDHVTINRFRSEYQDALAGLFGQVLRLCARAGMVKVGVIAVDGTRVAANASIDANADYEQIARKILEEAAEIDAAEDELHGDKRGDELPEQSTTRHGRQTWLREAKRQLEAERAADPKPVPRARAPRLGSEAAVGGGAVDRAARERCV